MDGKLAGNDESVFRAKISAFVITKNESEKIADCLESLKWVDEIVVVDDFSTDGTMEICRNHGATVVQRVFTGFKDQKSYAMSLTANEWVLEIDSDERVSELMRKSILGLGKKEYEQFSAFKFRRLTRFWGRWIRHASLYPDYKARLYNKQRGAWSEGNIHERFKTGGPVAKLEGDILHVQDLALVAYIQRTARYSNLAAEELYERGGRTRLLLVIIRPAYTFFYRYIFRLGILDGLHGFIVSLMGALGTFLKYGRLYELQHGLNIPPERDKRQLRKLF